MHVNQFVPFFMQYHAVSPQQLDDFHADYAKQTMINPQLKDFDLKLLEIFNNRRTRYISRFYSDGESFDDFEEGQHDQETSKANAESFQQSDLQELRELFKEVCNGYIQQLEAAEDKFTEEREFFLRQSEKDKEAKEDLFTKIANLEKCITQEKDQNYQMFIQKEVQKSCLRAIVKHDSMADQAAPV